MSIYLFKPQNRFLIRFWRLYKGNLFNGSLKLTIVVEMLRDMLSKVKKGDTNNM